MKKLFLIVFAITFSIYFLTSAGATPYDYFTRLATSFLHGKYYLTEAPSWLNELVPIAKNKFAVIYPPGPAILLIPFVFIFGNNFPQQIFSHLVGALTSSLWFLIAYKVTRGNLSKSIWLTILVSIANILWFLTSNGSVWYLGQTTAVLFLSLAFFEKNSQNKPFLIGVFLGMAFICRIEIILAALFFILLAKPFKNKLKIILGILPFVAFYLFYNFIRFGSFFQTGYALIPYVLKEPWYANGLMHYSYITRHLKVIFTSLPIVINKFPYLIPSWNGLAIWITTPAFFYSFLNSFKLKTVQLAWASILIMAFFVFLHGTTGFSQFGYRFAVIFYPFLFFLISQHLKRTKLGFHHWFFLTLSVLVNLWGVILINKLGLVSY